MKPPTRLGRHLTLTVIGCAVLLGGVAVAASTAVKLNGGGTAALSCAGKSLSIQRANSTSANASCVPSSTPTFRGPPPPSSTTPPPTTTTPPTTTPPTTTQPPQTGFPNASNTGVPAGTTLTTVNGDFTTTSDGQTINAKLITGDLKVYNNNVTVTDTRIEGRIVYQPPNTGLSLTDTDVGPNACPSGPGDYQLLSGSNYTLLRVHFHNNNEDLLRAGGNGGTISVTDSLFNQTCWYTSSHLDAFQLYDPGDRTNVTLNHDTLDVRPVNASSQQGNSAVFWADDPGAGSSLELKDSELAGGQYTTALYGASAGSGVVLNVHDNTYVNHSWDYGACSSSLSVPYNGHEGLLFTNNVLDTGGAVTC